MAEIKRERFDEPRSKSRRSRDDISAKREYCEPDGNCEASRDHAPDRNHGPDNRNNSEIDGSTRPTAVLAGVLWATQSIEKWKLTHSCSGTT